MPPSPPDTGVSPNRNNKKKSAPDNVDDDDDDGRMPSNENSRAHQQAVFIRPDDEVEAMSWSQRAGKRLSNMLGGGGKGAKHDEDESEENANVDDDDEEADVGGGHHGNGNGSTSFRPVQYRLEATRVAPKRGYLRWLFTCCGLFDCCSNKANNNNGTDQSLVVGMNPNQQLAMYLHWMFRVNFLVLFAAMCTMFFALVILFAGFIAMAGSIDNDCVRIGGSKYGSANTPFADAFALSWTTFSTVGYGSTYPALGHENTSPTNCFFINFICSLESLLGVLYSGFCGAILFGKVLRIQSQAQVIFSDPILIRYGTGLLEDNCSNNLSAADEDAHGKLPCPVMEFRIVNRLFSEPGGEIMDATLNVVANIDADDADPTLRNALEGSGMVTNTTSIGRSETDSASEQSGSNFDSLSVRSENSTLKRSILRLVTPFTASMKKDHQAVDEDPTSRLVSKHIFSKMLIEASDHPFFKRVWLARHVLDEHSPVLKPRVRRQIRRNGGAWPDRLNTHSAIRDSLRFNQILVSLNGVSNVSASDVYAQKIYDYIDVNIGYQFVNILYRDSDNQLGVDTDLINDVREQTGGGGEPLIVED